MTTGVSQPTRSPDASPGSDQEPTAHGYASHHWHHRDTLPPAATTGRVLPAVGPQPRQPPALRDRSPPTPYRALAMPQPERARCAALLPTVRDHAGRQNPPRCRETRAERVWPLRERVAPRAPRPQILPVDDGPWTTRERPHPARNAQTETTCQQVKPAMSCHAAARGAANRRSVAGSPSNTASSRPMACSSAPSTRSSRAVRNVTASAAAGPGACRSSSRRALAEACSPSINSTPTSTSSARMCALESCAARTASSAALRAGTS